MAFEQEESMSSVDSPSMFAQVIQEHLELKRRNAALEHEMPIEKYMNDDPFENHPLFKTEEQARVEDTMDGVQSIEDEVTSLDWPVSEDTFIDAPTVIAAAAEDERRGAQVGGGLGREPLVALARLRLGRLAGGRPTGASRRPAPTAVARSARRGRVLRRFVLGSARVTGEPRPGGVGVGTRARGLARTAPGEAHADPRASAETRRSRCRIGAPVHESCVSSPRRVASNGHSVSFPLGEVGARDGAVELVRALRSEG